MLDFMIKRCTCARTSMLGIVFAPIILLRCFISVSKKMAGHRGSHAKRQSDSLEDAGRKRRHVGEERESYAPGPEDTVYRYLCPARRIGGIIGRGGEIAKQLRAETQAKIRIADSVPGCEERVVTIFSSSMETNTSEEFEDNVCPAQDALFKVHERLATDEGQRDEEGEVGASQVSVRLLIPSDQIGCIIGKGGQIIQGIRSDSGAQVRVLSKEHLPACAIPGDELLQITGDASVVKKALLNVSSRLHENPSRSNHILSASVPQTFVVANQYSDPSSVGPIMGIAPIISPYARYKGDVAGDWHAMYTSRRDESSVKEFTLRLLCPAANIGGVIGKGGGIIRQIRQESNATIKVDSNTADEDCIITISAKESFEDPVSPTIDAAIRLQPRCSDKTEDKSGEPSYTTRLLVSTSHIGCLIGKGGSIITEMRRTTRANIRILSKDNIPKVAAADDEMVQIIGGLDVARHALVQVTTRLKANTFEREGALAAIPPSIPYQSLQVAPSEGLLVRRDSDSLGHDYSYSSRYDMLPLDGYKYRPSEVRGVKYGTYSHYSGGSASPGLHVPSYSYGKRHGK